MASRRCRGGCSAGFIKKQPVEDYTKGVKGKKIPGTKFPAPEDFTKTLVTELPKKRVINGKK